MKSPDDNFKVPPIRRGPHDLLSTMKTPRWWEKKTRRGRGREGRHAYKEERDKKKIQIQNIWNEAPTARGERELPGRSIVQHREASVKSEKTRQRN